MILMPIIGKVRLIKGLMIQAGLVHCSDRAPQGLEKKEKTTTTLIIFLLKK